MFVFLHFLIDLVEYYKQHFILDMSKCMHVVGHLNSYDCQDYLITT